MAKGGPLNFSQYEVFLKTAELGSLTKAADALGYTQSGVTHLLNSLEDQFGFKLLHRNRKGVCLTSYGEAILPGIRSVLHQQHVLQEQVNDLNGMRSGLIRIGNFTSVSSHWLPGMICLFRQDYPGIRFDLMHGTNEDNERWVREGSADLAFVRVPAASDLESVPLATDPLVAVVPVGSDLSSRESISLEIFEQAPYIALSEGVDDEISDIIRRHSIHPDTQFTEKDDYAVLAMIEQGLGISIMPELVLKGTSRDVVSVPLDPPAHRDLGIAYKNKAMLSHSARVFIDYAQRYLSRTDG